MMPPRPDVGAAVVGLAASVAAYLLTGDPSTVIIGVLIGILSLPIIFMAREFAVFRARRVLKPEEAGVVADWIREASIAVGAKGDVTVLYTVRKGLGLQVIQLGGVLERSESQMGLFQLLHRVAWSALPAATRTKRGGLLVAVPAKVMETLYGLSGKGRSGVYMSLSSPGHVRLVYSILREIAAAVNVGAGRVYAAYLATKGFARMLLSGWLRLDPELANRLDTLVPSEPPWIRKKVIQQLAEEEALAVKA